MRDKAAIGERIARAVAGSDLSVAELAQRIGRSRDTIYAWMKAESLPDAYDLLKVCGELGVSADALLGLEPRLQTGVCYLDAERLRAVLATTEPRELRDLMEWDLPPVDLGGEIPDGSIIVSPHEGRSAVNRAARHIEAHAPRVLDRWRDAFEHDIKAIFRDIH